MTSSDAHFKALLSKHNNNQSEKVKLYGKILKINKRNKKQQRTFVLTDKAIYNIKPKNNKIKRRIDLLDIASITTSSTSAEFSINIPSEYDYHFDAMDVSFRNEIIATITQQMAAIQHQIFINQISETSTMTWTVSKNVLKKVNSHNYDDSTLRTVMALDHLTNMGFKSKMAHKALKQNKMDLSLTIQCLIAYKFNYAKNDKKERTSFRSKGNSPLITKINSVMSASAINSLIPTTPQQLTPSSTEQVDDYFVVAVD